MKGMQNESAIIKCFGLGLEWVDKEASQKVWGASPAGTTHGGGAEPGSREFFEQVVKKRSSYEIPWLYELVPFSLFRGKKVLEVGCGAGYDALELCQQGADYTGIDITPENIERTQRHLGFYGYSPNVLLGDAESLPFEDASFDVVFSNGVLHHTPNGVLHHTPNISESFNEANRVLNSSGEFWVILYHKNSVYYWISLFLVDHILKRGFRHRSFRERLSMIEYTTSDRLPLVNAYTRRELKKLLKNAGFRVDAVWVRKLLKEDLPIIHIVDALWQYIPQPMLDFAGKRFGWYLIAKAVKP